ncbi:MAG TPA: hypothetical protein PLU38_05655 [Kiritimatiellia bacterium]|jgi:hypothetical protein|nr:MAG: hypothetical protein BWX70_00218 [Verrucomicrobia bacterium ADurb.Bin070]HPO36645.1 hypothetical protein [Kiritimatiellia bacterium]HQQ91333.1 hypothetical protein [Kiritimatiellia bacterium]
MLIYLTLPLIVAAAALIAGATPATWLAAALGAAAAAWRARLAGSAGTRMIVTLDPLAPDSRLVLAALREALRQLARTRHVVSLRTAAFRATAHPRLHLSLSRDGDLEIHCDGARVQRLRQPGIWIADHPLPLKLPRAHCLTLRFTPADGGRVRVALAAAAPLSRRGWFAVVFVIAAACVCDAASVLAGALGFAAQTYLLEHHPDRPRDQQQVKAT